VTGFPDIPTGRDGFSDAGRRSGNHRDLNEKLVLTNGLRAAFTKAFLTARSMLLPLASQRLLAQFAQRSRPRFDPVRPAG
jgi:hypothetical protein